MRFPRSSIFSTVAVTSRGGRVVGSPSSLPQVKRHKASEAGAFGIWKARVHGTPDQQKGCIPCASAPQSRQRQQGQRHRPPVVKGHKTGQRVKVFQDAPDARLSPRVAVLQAHSKTETGRAEGAWE